MTFHSFRLSLSLVLVSVLFSGCADKKPSGFPEVYPCTIKILKDGAPLNKVSIVLDATTPAFHNIGYSGETNSQGTAVIETRYPDYHTKGVPAGEYRVLLKKREVIEGEKTLEELRRMNSEELEVYTAEIERKRRTHVPTIPPKFWEFETSPLRITVERGGVDITFDINDFSGR